MQHEFAIASRSRRNGASDLKWYKKGERTRASIDSTRAQANTPLTDVTVQYQTATQQREAVATTAQIDTDSLRHELRVSQEQGSFCET